jgi:hypothetical protein
MMFGGIKILNDHRAFGGEVDGKPKKTSSKQSELREGLHGDDGLEGLIGPT